MITYGFHPVEGRTAVCIGAFDGFHRGHQKIIAKTVALAKKSSLTPVLVTFEPDPEEFIHHRKNILLTTPEEKIALASAYGVEEVRFLKFDEELMNVSAEIFIGGLAASLRPDWIVFGEDFRFGYDQRGDHEFLIGLKKEFGFNMAEVPIIQYGGEKISSTRIRKLIVLGKVEEAGELLGHTYFLSGRIIKGSGRASGIGFPTANLEIDPRKIIPGKGVYSGHISWPGNLEKCLIYVGTSPTLKIDRLQVEAHIPGKSVDLSGKNVTIAFENRLRAEMDFDTAEALVEQIKRDIAETE